MVFDEKIRSQLIKEIPISMKVTNKRILESIQSMRELQSRKLPSKMTYAIMKNTRVLEDASNVFNDTRRKITADHSELEYERNQDADEEHWEDDQPPIKRDEDGEPIVKKDRNGDPVIKRKKSGDPVWKSDEERERAVEAMNEVIEEEVEIDIHMFKAEDLPNDIEPGLLLPIDFMIKDQ